MDTTPDQQLLERLLAMNFAERLTAARKQQGLTQQQLADRVGVHVTQLRRYEAGTNQPTLDVLRALAVALSVSTDSLVFDDHERGPGDDLRLTFEATQRLDPDERTTVRQLIEAILLRHEARRLTQPTAS
jgi:transcriptional regulator with XRE-family HTH domain